MTSGPPPWAAESSGFRENQSPTSSSSFSTAPTTFSTTTQLTSGVQPYSTHSWRTTLPATYTYPGPIVYPLTTQPLNPQTHISYYQPENYQPQTHSGQQHQYQAYQPPPIPAIAPVAKPPSPSPSPPPPEPIKHWDKALKGFLTQAGLTQALWGFENDMIVLNPIWEKERIPGALRDLVKNLSEVKEYPTNQREDVNMPTPEETGSPLEERKLEYVHLANGAQPRSQTSINKSISAFLAENRARNNASNRSEFLYTLAEKKRKLLDDQNGGGDAPIPSCARTDAKPVDRDLQMKYDIAKNEGPLRRTTVKAAVGEESSAPEEREEEQKKAAVISDASSDQDLEEPERATAARYPAIHERLENVEAHLAIRYVPSPPRTLVARLKFLEDHIIQLEKEYPPWAALHFNQPNRGWPPPPRATPIIVPPHLRPKEHPDPPPPTMTNMGNVALIQAPAVGGGGAVPKARGKQSSLQRAVLEKLEIQQAMSDLGKGRGGSG